MGLIYIHSNPMVPNEAEEHEFTGELIRFLEDKYPRGFPGPTTVLRNGNVLEVCHFDIMVGTGDKVDILISPGWATVGVFIAKAFVGVIVGAAVNFATSWLRGAPDTPDSPTPHTASPTYSLAVPTNQARLGETMPVVYGSVLAVPDIVSQPYSEYVDNDQYIGMIIGIGRGNHQIDGLQVADTPISSLAPGVFQYWDYPAAAHQGVLGKIQSETGIYENIDTSPEVSNQEFDGVNPVGPFVTNGVGTTTQLLGFDIVFPAGIHAEDAGQLTLYTFFIRFEAWEIDDAGVSTGKFYFRSEEFSGDSSDPKRYTIWWELPPSRYKTSVHRETPPYPYVGYESRATWSSLKAVLRPPLGPPNVLYVFDSNTETDLSGWTVGGPSTWRLVANRACTGGTLVPATTNPQFIASDYIAGNTATKTLNRTFDVSADAVAIDTGLVRVELLCQLATHDVEPDAVKVYVRALDAPGGTILRTWTAAATNDCGWTSQAITEDLPVDTREIELSLESVWGGSDSENSGYFDDISLTLYGALEGELPPVYEDMHLLVLRMKATSGIAQDATRRISAHVTRKTAEGFPSTNPFETAQDIYQNTSYGGNRPIAEIDVPRWEEMKLKHADNPGFNGVFDSQTTVWTAMQQAMRSGDSAPTIYGGKVTIAEDVFGPVSYAFDASNMVQGSANVTRTFDADDEYDGYEVEYLDNVSFLPLYTRYPPESLYPERVTYFGCTDQELAEWQAEFLWKKKYWRRKRCTWDTEAIGHLPLIGDRVSVVHPAVNNGVDPENYIVESVTPGGQFSVQLSGVRDADIWKVDIRTSQIMVQSVYAPGSRSSQMMVQTVIRPPNFTSQMMVQTVTYTGP